ncbi:CRAL-TRIO domain-containing protein [Collybia nuda]|uniref:Phosphatidylinositol transfer protein SFH5 n=1 Tax=Collybia nuda TaxID=64659 RepID=A0A9P5Y4N3_9AGAR|nr:CRAL-TRIO domain-containing protein [Collybia nuda]
MAEIASTANQARQIPTKEQLSEGRTLNPTSTLSGAETPKDQSTVAITIPELEHDTTLTREANIVGLTPPTPPVPTPAEAVAAPAASLGLAQPTVGSPIDNTKKEIDNPEPQSTLTKLFTEAEWISLKEFRAQLSDIFADGHPDDPKARDIPITMWGVRIDPCNPIDARVSVVLMKFLRARNLSVRDAREMLVSTLRWRQSFGVESAMKEEFPENIFGQVGKIYGRDKGGRPVVYNIYGGNEDLKAVFGDVQRFLRWRVALMEKSIALLDFTEVDQTVQIHDYEGVSLTSRDANTKNAASEASSIFQGHYPELLHRKFFVNVPTLLNWIFWVFKPLISANTLSKMAVVGTSHHAMQKALLPIIDAKELPKRYGGEADAF